VAYVVIAWLVAQVAAFATETFGAPPWVLQIFVVFLLLGLPVAILLAWAFDLTPDGIRRTASTTGEGDGNEQPGSQRRAIFVVFILFTLAAAAWLQFYGPEPVTLSGDKRRPLSATSADNTGQSLHFDLALPENAPLAVIGAAELGNGKRAFAISPNGQLVVYAGASGDGHQLYLRDIRGHNTVPLEGTTDAFNPFFAPNNAWIGFFVGNELFKYNVSSGESLFVAEATNSVGAAWTDNDEIVMVIEEGRGLVSVPASNGKVEVIQTDRRVMYPTAIRHQQKLTLNGVLLDLDTLKHDNLPVQSQDIRYMNGYLFFTFQDSLLAARFDLAANELTSKPIPVITGLRSEIWGVSQWSVSDDGTMLYLPGRDARSSPLYWVNSTHKEALDLPVRMHGTMELSADGSRLAIVEDVAGATDVWVYQLPGGRATKLTTDGISSGPLFWSPEGDAVYYQKRIGSTDRTYRSFIDSQLPAETVLNAVGDQVEATSITADGQFMGIHGANGIGVYDVMAEEMTAVPTATNDDWGSAISPDGRAIVYTSSISGTYHNYLQPLPTTGERHQVSRQGGSEEPRWSTDGSKIYYRSGARIMMVDVVTEPEVKLGEPQVFFSEGFENVGGRSYAVHPDGERAVVIRSGNFASSIRVVTNWFAKVEQLIQESESENN